MISSEQWIADAVARLKRAGYREVEVTAQLPPGTRALRRADSRPRWMMTRLHTFVVLMAVDEASTQDIQDMPRQA